VIVDDANDGCWDQPCDGDFKSYGLLQSLVVFGEAGLLGGDGGRGLLSRVDMYIGGKGCYRQGGGLDRGSRRLQEGSNDLHMQDMQDSHGSRCLSISPSHTIHRVHTIR
jgi:hypothetical protein